MSKSVDTIVCEFLQVERGEPMVSSVAVAREFCRPHNEVLKSIRKEIAGDFSLGDLTQRDYIDARGKTQPMYLLTERQALFLMPFIGGVKSREGQLALVDAFLAYRENFASPPRQSILQDKRDANRPMLDALVEAREELGKQTSGVHYMSESKLCNGIVTGKFSKIDEKSLSNADAELLRDVRKRNEAYLLAGLDYVTRKARLHGFATKNRTRQITK